MNYKDYQATTPWGKIMESSAIETIDNEMYNLEHLVNGRDTKGYVKFYDHELNVWAIVQDDELQDCINVRRKRVFYLVASFLDLPVNNNVEVFPWTTN